MTDYHIEAAIVIQGYLLEILLLHLVHNQANPLQTLDLIRFQLKTQLASDRNFQQPIPPELAQAMDGALAAALDRVAGQLTNPPPPRHDA